MTIDIKWIVVGVTVMIIIVVIWWLFNYGPGIAYGYDDNRPKS